METEIFKNKTEFKIKYPSGLYVCAYCGQMTDSEIVCGYCGFRADGILKTMEKGYKYKIEDTGETSEIFNPTERMK